MIQRISRIFVAALALGLAAATTLSVTPAEAQSPSVLRVARGLASNNITVIENRAIVVESAQPFIEVSVAQPSIADVSPLSDRSLYVFGRSRGITTLTLLGEGGQLITNVTVQVIPDIAQLKSRISAIMPDERVEVRAAGGNIILSGTVSSKEKLDDIIVLAEAYAGSAINMMTVGGTQQVMMKVRVAEMSREASKALGIDLNAFGFGGDVAGLLSGPGDGGFDFTPGVDPGGVTIEDSGLGIIARFGNFGINLVINALEGRNFARTLAEPNLVALSGQSASFLVGGEVPIPVATDDNTITVTFKRVGVILDFTPTVLTEDIINLRLSAEVSDVTGSAVDTGLVNIPTFTTNRSSTTIELRDGQSFAIAGLIRKSFSDDISQFPWIGDVPILGALFRSSSYTNRESELVIIVSAHLVKPVDGDLLAIPDDRVTIPNEAELFLLGKTVEPTVAGDIQTQGFDGGFGYVVE